jgi:hypothetical protein
MGLYGNEILNSNEIKTRVKEFAERHKNSHYEKGQTQSFYDDFWRVFGRDRMSFATYEKEIKQNDSNGFIDVFWPKWLIIEQKSEGRDLVKAMAQADKYCANLSENLQPRYILACDFQTFHLVDRIERKDWTFKLSDLSEKIQYFDFMRGLEQYEIIDEDPVNTVASEMLGQIYEILEEYGYGKHNMVYLLTRLTYCLFADDTDIFEANTLQKFLKTRTSVDGSDLGGKLVELFQVLNTPVEKRAKNLDEDLAAFPYINGNLFQDSIAIPSFDSKMRDLLINACEFNWSKVSPVIFGSLFQSVMNGEERHSSGGHYTKRKNIMKVIRPLFLDNLIDEFNLIKQIKTNQRKKNLEKFQEKLSQLKFLDPACGSGNFLIVAYQELRRLELHVISELYDKQIKRLDVSILSKISIDQFYGIEINEFSAHISQVSLWMMEHLMNQELSNMFGESFIDIPLKTHPNILNQDALEIDWNDLLPNNECSFIFGNPPYLGANNYKFQQHIEKGHQIKRLADIGDKGGVLDYVTGWFLKAGEYANELIHVGFVSTNSIIQGQQVGHLWDILLGKYNFKINFVFKDFKWKSDARGAATVTVVIIGFSKTSMDKKRLFYLAENKIVEENPKYISPYLIGSDIELPIVRKTSSSLNNLPTIIKGSQPRDNQHYIFTHDEKRSFLEREPGAEPFLRPYVNADGFLKNVSRWILTLQNIKPNELRKLPEIKKRVAEVKLFRSKSDSSETRELDPLHYYADVIPTNPFLVIPATTSERREYIPLGFLEPPIIPSNATMIIENASLGLFGLLSSKMHMLWVRTVGGKLESRLRYSVGIIYKTFPLPENDFEILENVSKKILQIRSKYPDNSLEDLYDPVTMPSDLKKAHFDLDIAVEKLYRSKPFSTDDERISFLLSKYEEMIEKK